MATASLGKLAYLNSLTYSDVGAAASSHGTHVSYGTSTQAIGTSSAGTATTVSRSDHVHAISLATGDGNGQVKIAGTNVSVKGLAALAYKASLTYSDVGAPSTTGTNASGTWGITVTGNSGAVSYQNSTLKISSTTFNISSQYERNLVWIGDSTGTGLGRINFIAKTDGTTQTSIQTRCWNTSGNAVGIFAGISILGKRDNTVTYTVNSPANFRSAISAYSTGGGTLTGNPSIYPSATDSAWTSVAIYGGRSGTGTHKDSSNGVTYTGYEGKPWCVMYMQNRFKAVNSSSTTTWNCARIFFRQYSAAASSGTRNGYYENYYLPATNDGRTDNATYNILTTKSAVTVAQGGTGATSFTANCAIISGSSTTAALTTRAITNMTTKGPITYNTNLMTTNTLAYWDGSYNTSHNSNISYVGTISGGTWQGTSIKVGYGGTGTTTAPTQGGIIYASSTSAYASTAAGTSGQYLKSNGTSAPTWATMPAGTTISANTGKIFLTGYASATKSAGLTYTLQTNTNVYISGTTGYLYAARVYNAVWNDIAEYRQTDNIEMGRVYQENNNGIMTKTQTRLIPGCSIASDTFGTVMGETTNAQTPMAIAGRVLVYTYQDRNNYQAGMVVCSAPNGTVDIMTREEIMMYPDAIIGTVSEIPEYEIWGHGNVKVDGRIWIKLK